VIHHKEPLSSTHNIELGYDITFGPSMRVNKRVDRQISEGATTQVRIIHQPHPKF